MEPFVLILGDVCSAVLKGDCTAWGWILCLSKKAYPRSIIYVFFQEKWYLPPSGNRELVVKMAMLFWHLQQRGEAGLCFLCLRKPRFFQLAITDTYWENDSQDKLERKQAFKHLLETTSFWIYKYGLFHLPILILELLRDTCPPEGMWDIFSSWAQKGKGRFPKQVPFQNGILHWRPWPLPLHLECWGMVLGQLSCQQ